MRGEDTGDILIGHKLLQRSGKRSHAKRSVDTILVGSCKARWKPYFSTPHRAQSLPTRCLGGLLGQSKQLRRREGPSSVI